MSALFDQRYRAAKQTGLLAGHTFRVVNADSKDMHLWSEIGTGGGTGMTWRGTMAEFRATFALVKGEPPPPTVPA
jgi:hypothetical protein